MKIRSITVVLGLCLVASALLVRVVLAPGSRDSEDAAKELLSASQEVMTHASRLDVALSMPASESKESFDALLARVPGPSEKKAIASLRACVLAQCPDLEDLALAAKLSLGDRLKGQRKLLAERQEASRRNENILFGLLGLCMLLALYLAFYGTSEARAASTSEVEEPPQKAEEGEGEGESTGGNALEEEYRKRLEQLYKVRKEGRENARFAAFGEIAAGLSHGLKTPLACVRAATQVAQAKLGDEHPAQQNLDSVIDEVDDLVSQINRFLKSMGGGAPVFRRLDAKSLLKPLDKRYREGLPDKKVVWRVTVPEDAQEIFGESELIEMALRNLIDNAMEATSPDSEVELRVGLCPAPSRVGVDAAPPAEELKERDWTEIAILDRGPGIAEDVTNKERVESTRAEGSGLGIAIARRIAARLGGTLTLQPREDGDGTRASFVLPPCNLAEPEESP